MESAERLIETTNMFKKGDIVGVGCSGGSDSIALLHYLATNSKKYDIKVVAITINHQIRENSMDDCLLVEELAKTLGIRCYTFNIDVPALASEKGESLETAARVARYNIFKALVEKGRVNKIALAHHSQDQAETILMHIFRGCGIAGARGMEAVSENIYLRPFLTTKKAEILQYINENSLTYNEDYTNNDTNYTRNFLRNVLFKEILTRWPNAVEAINNFGLSAKQDDDYINSQLVEDAIINEDKLVKIPLTYFLYSPSIVARIIFKAFKSLGINKDIERKHIDLITRLALHGSSGSKINLPFRVTAVKEYDYLTLHSRQKQEVKFAEMFGCGEIKVPGFGSIFVRKTKSKKLIDGELAIDGDKLPQNVVWRFRQEGDEFVRFGSGRKKLKSYFINSKIPARERASLPLLASGKEILVVAGKEISENVKIDENTKFTYRIRVKKI